MRSYHGKRLDTLANEIRLTYARFPHVIKVVFDHRGLGDALPEFLSQPWTHPESGKEYPPWVLDSERTMIHNADPILRSVIANAQINQQLASCLRIALEQNTLELPVSSRLIRDNRLSTADEDDEAAAAKSLTVQERAIYLESDALQVEMGNIVMRASASGTVLYDTARPSQHKDRYSALAMAVWYISELEEARKRRMHQPLNVCVGVVSRF